MALRNLWSESTAGQPKSHVINVPTGSKIAYFDSLTVSTHGADVAADVGITIVNNGRTKWGAWLRSAQIYGAHFSDIGDIELTSNDLTVETTSGGAGVIVSVAAVVNIR